MSDPRLQNRLLFQATHADEEAIIFLVSDNSMYERSSTLFSSPSLRRSITFKSDFDLPSVLTTTGDICVVETRVDNVDNDERGFSGSAGGNGAEGEKLEEFELVPL